MPDAPTTSDLAHSPQQIKQARKVSLRIAAVYLFIALTWILASDIALNKFMTTFVYPSLPPDLRDTWHTRAQIAKGWFYMSISAVALFFLVRYYIRSIHQTENQLHRKISRTADEFRYLFEDNPLPMFVYEPASYAIINVNNAAILKYGYPREQFLQLKITQLRPPEDAEKFIQTLLHNRNLSVTTFISRHLKKDSSVFDAQVTAHPTTVNDKPARLVVVFDVTERVAAQKQLEQYRLELEHRVIQRTEDLTSANAQLQREIEHRQRIEEQLRRAKHEADQANEAKSAFVANTTHELRTPLSSILGYAELLRDPALPPATRRHHVDVIHHSALQLMTLIDELLDLARIEAGRIAITTADFDPRELLQHAFKLLQPRAAQKNLDLQLHIADDIPPTIRTDGARLRQILLNLLANAVKFTERGSITLHVANHSPTALVFRIADTGIGIAPEHLPRIFEPFFQVDSANAKTLGGTGLGLPISKQLAEKLGGSLTVESTPGKGSTFTLIIPRATTENHRPSPQPTLRAHILLAEDDPNLRWLIEEYLRRAGASVTPAASAQQAIEAHAAANDHKKPFDLILLDISMPGMDGTDCAAVLRSRGFTGPLVAITARTDPQQQQRCLNAGFNTVLPKPIDTQSFIPSLAKLVATKTTP